MQRTPFDEPLISTSSGYQIFTKAHMNIHRKIQVASHARAPAGSSFAIAWSSLPTAVDCG
jgi:hypothetical protein